MSTRRDLPPSLVGSPFHVREAESLGVPLSRLRASDLVTPFRGVRAGAMPRGLRQLCDAYLPRLRPGQCFSHLTAARVWGVPLPSELEDDVLHVASVGGTRPRLPGVAGHELSDPRTAVVVVDGLPVTDAATTWVHLVRWLHVGGLVIAGDHLVGARRGKGPACTPDELRMRVVGATRKRAATLSRAASLVRIGSESPRETLLRLQLVAAGLPEPEVNFDVRDGAGAFVARVDMGYPELRIAVEYDGDQHRTSTKQYDRDIERHDALLALGWTHIRVRKHTPWTGPRSAPSRVAAALAARGSTRGSRVAAALAARTDPSLAASGGAPD